MGLMGGGSNPMGSPLKYANAVLIKNRVGIHIAIHSNLLSR